MRFLERLRRVSVAGNRTLRVATDLRPTAVDPVMLLPYGAKKRPRLGRCWSSLLRNSWGHKFACFEVNEAQAESLCAVTEVAERPGAMLGLIGLDSRIGVVDVTS